METKEKKIRFTILNKILILAIILFVIFMIDRLLLGIQFSAIKDLAMASESVKECNSIKEIIGGVQVQIFITFFIMICFLLVMVWIIWLSFRPFRKLIYAISSLAEKNLTIRIQMKEKNEIGQIGSAFDTMAGALDEFFGKIKKDYEEVAKVNEDLTSAVDQSSAATREMVASIESVHMNLQKHKEVVDNTIDSINIMMKITEQIKENVESQAGAVAESSASVEEMVSSINSVSNSSEKAEKLSKKLSDIARDGGEKLTLMMKAMQEIQNASSKIAEAIGGIARIAATTNLLSMNAAIEAAHAGAAGRGFAVVAEEIRKLAADSSEEAKTIKQNVKETIDKIEHGTKLSEDAGKAFNEIMIDIDATVNIVMEITSAMSEQRLGAQEILKSMEHLVNLSSEISEAIRKETEGGEKVMEATSQLDQVATEILSASSEQKIGSEEILGALQLLQDVSEKIRTNVSYLNEGIDKFKVSE
ncbi:MAG: HAMP domain-containing protein [Spirochaetales bacterium]|nr:HAMP domain-containing protein [Spirochaetales bacterium]